MEISVEDIQVGERKRPISADKVATIAESMEEIGLIHPILVKEDWDTYELVAGLHRLEAAKVLGWDKIPATVFALGDLEAELAEIDENIMRANLTILEESLCLARRKEIYEELHPETKYENRPGRRGKNDVNVTSFIQDAAEKVEKSQKTVSTRARIGIQLAPIADKLKGTLIENNQSELLELTKIMEEDPVEAESVVDSVISGEVVSVRSVVKERQQKEKTEKAQSLKGSKVYNVIYADPPWQYENTVISGAAENHYETMTLEDICNLLQKLELKVADDAVLFLWVTNPFVEDAFKVVHAWGFSYKTNIVWCKTELEKPGSGFYVRGRHELLYICTKGAFTPLDKHISPPIGSVLESPVREHSRKPEEVYTIIERLYPNCNYIELFARAPRDGWEVWGDEVGKY